MNPELNTDPPARQPSTTRLWQFMRSRARWWRHLGWPAERIARALGCSLETVETLLGEEPQ